MLSLHLCNFKLYRHGIERIAISDKIEQITIAAMKGRLAGCLTIRYFLGLGLA